MANFTRVTRLSVLPWILAMVSRLTYILHHVSAYYGSKHCTIKENGGVGERCGEYTWKYTIWCVLPQLQVEGLHTCIFIYTFTVSDGAYKTVSKV